MARQGGGTTQERGTDGRPSAAGVTAGGDAASVIRQVYEWLGNGQVDRIASLCTDDVRWTSIPTGKTFTGEDGTRQFMESLTIPFPDVKLEITSLASTPDRVAVEWVGRGHHKGPFTIAGGRQVPPTNKPIELRFSEWFELRGGKIAQARVYFDVLTLMTQIGVERH